MMRFRFVSISLSLGLATLLLMAGYAHAASISFASGTSVLKWKKTNIPYHLNSAGSADISDGSDLQAVHASFTDWTSLSCGNLSVYHAGDTTANSTILTGGNTNNKNDFTWVETSAWQYGQYVLGITSPVFSPSGAIQEADIALNGYLATWTTINTFGGKSDVKSIALHEVGHWYGIQHNLSADTFSTDAPTMVPAWNGSTAARTLEQDDINAFCFLYPASGTYSCSTDDQCPYVVGGSGGNEGYVGQYGCDGGTCIWGSGGNNGGGNTGGDGSCEGKCGDFSQGWSCQCDDACNQYGDCCDDYSSICEGGSSEGGGSEGGGNTGGSGSGPVYDCLMDYCVSDFCFNFDVCVDVVACIGDCNDSTCAQGCVNAAPGASQQILGTLVTCAESNGCFDLDTGGGSTEGGASEEGGGNINPEGGGDNPNAGYDCPGFFACANNCSDQVCFDSCSNNTDPAIFSTVSNAFICLQNNGCMSEATPEEENICATAYCLNEMTACYGADFTPSYPPSAEEGGSGEEGGSIAEEGGANTGDEGIVGGDGDKGGLEGGGDYNPFDNTGGGDESVNNPGGLTINEPADEGGCSHTNNGEAPLLALFLMVGLGGWLRRKTGCRT